MIESKNLATENSIKIQKANQGDIINTILKEFNDIKNPDIENEFEEGIKHGICYMLSLEWLRLIIIDDSKWKNGFGKLKNPDDKNELAYYKQIANNFFAYNKRKYGLKHILKKPGTVADDRELYELATANKATIKDIEYNVKNVNEMAEKMVCEEKYLTIRLLLKEAGHRIAAYRYDENTMYLYDPNIGTVLIKGSDTRELIKELNRLLTVIWNFYEIQHAVIRFVKLVE